MGDRQFPQNGTEMSGHTGPKEVIRTFQLQYSDRPGTSRCITRTIRSVTQERHSTTTTSNFLGSNAPGTSSNRMMSIIEDTIVRSESYGVENQATGEVLTGGRLPMNYQTSQLVPLANSINMTGDQQSHQPHSQQLDPQINKAQDYFTTTSEDTPLNISQSSLEEQINVTQTQQLDPLPSLESFRLDSSNVTQTYQPQQQLNNSRHSYEAQSPSVASNVGFLGPSTSSRQNQFQPQGLQQSPHAYIGDNLPSFTSTSQAFLQSQIPSVRSSEYSIDHSAAVSTANSSLHSSQIVPAQHSQNTSMKQMYETSSNQSADIQLGTQLNGLHISELSSLQITQPYPSQQRISLNYAPQNLHFQQASGSMMSNWQQYQAQQSHINPRFSHHYSFPQFQRTPGQITNTIQLQLEPAGIIRHTSLPAIQPAVSQIQPALPQIQPALPQIQPALPQIQPALPQTQAVLPHIQPALPHIQPALPQIQPTLPHIQPALPHIQPALPHIEPTLPHIQPALPHIQPALPHIQPALPQIQSAVPSIQPTVPSILQAVPPIQPGVPPASSINALLQPQQQTPPPQRESSYYYFYRETVVNRPIPGTSQTPQEQPTDYSRKRRWEEEKSALRDKRRHHPYKSTVTEPEKAFARPGTSTGIFSQQADTQRDVNSGIVPKIPGYQTKLPIPENLFIQKSLPVRNQPTINVRENESVARSARLDTGQLQNMIGKHISVSANEEMELSTKGNTNTYDGNNKIGNSFLSTNNGANGSGSSSMTELSMISEETVGASTSHLEVMSVDNLIQLETNECHVDTKVPMFKNENANSLISENNDDHEENLQDIWDDTWEDNLEECWEENWKGRKQDNKETDNKVSWEGNGITYWVDNREENDDDHTDENKKTFSEKNEENNKSDINGHINLERNDTDLEEGNVDDLMQENLQDNLRENTIEKEAVSRNVVSEINSFDTTDITQKVGVSRAFELQIEKLSAVRKPTGHFTPMSSTPSTSGQAQASHIKTDSHNTILVRRNHIKEPHTSKIQIFSQPSELLIIPRNIKVKENRHFKESETEVSEKREKRENTEVDIQQPRHSRFPLNLSLKAQPHTSELYYTNILQEDNNNNNEKNKEKYDDEKVETDKEGKSVRNGEIYYDENCIENIKENWEEVSVGKGDGDLQNTQEKNWEKSFKGKWEDNRKECKEMENWEENKYYEEKMEEKLTKGGAVWNQTDNALKIVYNNNPSFQEVAKCDFSSSSSSQVAQASSEDTQDEGISQDNHLEVHKYYAPQIPDSDLTSETLLPSTSASESAANIQRDSQTFDTVFPEQSYFDVSRNSLMPMPMPLLVSGMPGLMNFDNAFSSITPHLVQQSLTRQGTYNNLHLERQQL